MRIAAVGAVLLAVSCGGSSNGVGSTSTRDSGAGRPNSDAGVGGRAACEKGAEGCNCYGNHTCNGTLTCASDLCVDLGAGGGVGRDGGAAGAGGTGGAGLPPPGGKKGVGGNSSSGGITGSGGNASSGGITGGGGSTQTQCLPVNSLCSKTGACCLGLVCVTEAGRPNGVCTSACARDTDCSTGCCAPLSDSSAHVCAPSVYCAGSCLPEGTSCTAFPSKCCAGTTCLYDDATETTASCQYICTSDAECVLGCCSPIQGETYQACTNPSYCGGSCLPAGTRPCGLGTECCSGSYCTSDAINQICLPLCFTNAECPSGCCASQNGNGVTVCSDPAFCGH